MIVVDTGLKPGDSGSWIVDDIERRVLGMVVARSHGTGYIVSFADTRQDIAKTMGLQLKSVELPSRFDPDFATERSRTGRVPRASTRRSWANFAFDTIPTSIQAQTPQLFQEEAISDSWISGPSRNLFQYSGLIKLIAAGHILLIFCFDFSQNFSRGHRLIGQAFLLPVMVLLVWASCELELYCRPTVSQRRDIRKNIRQFFYDWFFVSLLGSFLGVVAAYLVHHVYSMYPRSDREISEVSERLKDTIRPLYSILLRLVTAPTDGYSLSEEVVLYGSFRTWINDKIRYIRTKLDAYFGIGNAAIPPGNFGGVNGPVQYGGHNDLDPFGGLNIPHGF